MNDYWDYLAHSAGSERKNHRYVARVPLGSRNGRVRFRYFYSSAEYAAYLRGRNNQQARNQKIGEQKKEMDRQRQAKRNANRIGEQHSMDRKRWSMVDRIAQVKADAKAYRKKKRDSARSSRIGEQHSMDRKRWAREAANRIGEQHSADRKRRDTEARAAQVKKDAEAYRRKRRKQNVTKQKVAMDAKRYRKQRQADRKENIQNQKKAMDRQRRKQNIAKQKSAMDRKRRKQNVTRQKVAMDAKRYRKQRLQKYARTHRLSVSSV